ncbi:MAG: serine protease [Chitinophagaceae bacterium]|nr:serine protease [Chitinophagaceae bacterium]
MLKAMDELLLIETVERYLSGEMTPQERSFFEEVRKKTPEVDQMVVEHTFFLHGLEKYSNLKSFKHSLIETEAKLMEDGVIKEPSIHGKARIIQLWSKYKRSMAVAASIALFISVLTAGLNIAYNNQSKQNDFISLKRELTKDIKEGIKKEVGSRLDTASHIRQKTPITDHGKYVGTSFLIDGKGYLVTNYHVISSMKNIYVGNNKGDSYYAEVVYTDNASDLAILKITDTSYKTIINLPYSIKRANSDLGEQFFTLGFPRNEIVYGEGYVSAKSGNDGDSLAYQLTVSANPGNSGGPVINKNGEIIGIITAKDAKADGVVYATKSKNIFRMLDELKKADTTAPLIKTPSGNGLKGIERTQQVKKMEEFVFMVVGN